MAFNFRACGALCVKWRRSMLTFCSHPAPPLLPPFPLPPPLPMAPADALLPPAAHAADLLPVQPGSHPAVLPAVPQRGGAALLCRCAAHGQGEHRDLRHDVSNGCTCHATRLYLLSHGCHSMLAVKRLAAGAVLTVAVLPQQGACTMPRLPIMLSHLRLRTPGPTLSLSLLPPPQPWQHGAPCCACWPRWSSFICWSCAYGEAGCCSARSASGRRSGRESSCGRSSWSGGGAAGGTPRLHGPAHDCGSRSRSNSDSQLPEWRSFFSRA